MVRGATAQATARLAELVDGDPIERPAHDRDQYGRIIAVVAAGADVYNMLVS